MSRDFIELPDDFPSFVRTLAQEVTRDVPSRYEKAVALQDWFREDGGFEYSLEQVDPGNGADELVAFLTEGDGGRVGYCEQFAASMAVMARSLGIPARVAVGFLEPERDRSRDVRVLQQRHARLAGALLRGRRLGEVRADPR